jgi:3-hydroxymyristoyl/3-hydroxydecanoyl-(acyl carrier protein) dehydratase
VNARIVVPTAGPLFDGHFPGMPILPGVAELIMVAGALAPTGPSVLTGVRHVRFRALVRPGDELDLVVPEGSTRFELRRDQEPIARGELEFDGQGTLEAEEVTGAARPVRDAPPMDALIPHRPPMRLVEEFLSEAEDGATCVARIVEGCGFAQGTAAPAIATLEAAAQTAAAWEALRRSRAASGGEPRIGYLVSVRDVVLDRATVPVDTALHATVRLDAHAPPLSHYVVSVAVLGRIALRGMIGTYLEK